MKIIHNKFLKISLITIFLFGVSLYFSNSSNSLMPKVYGSSLESSTSGEAVTTTATTPLSNQISSDTAFLSTLGALERIKIDTSLFTNKAFMALRDNAIKIDSVEPGRKNPFAPMSVNQTPSTVSATKVVTGEPSLITDKTVILNGTINTIEGVTNTYFEYGKTISFGTVTTTAEPSLVGAFIKNILGLTPKTSYFFKACAKINNVAICGDTVSFNNLHTEKVSGSVGYCFSILKSW